MGRFIKNIQPRCKHTHTIRTFHTLQLFQRITNVPYKQL